MLCLCVDVLNKENFNLFLNLNRQKEKANW